MQEKKHKVDYLYLEMILDRESKFDVVSGLFKGIIEKENQIFIALHGVKGATNVLNLKFYNIMTIEILEEDYRNMAYLTDGKDDQTVGLAMVKSVYKQMIEEKRNFPNDERIIDISTYKDVPKAYLDGKEIDSGVTNGTYRSPINKHVTGYPQNNSIPPKKDLTPEFFKRTKAKKPDKERLAALQEKLDQILAGKFEPNLPEIDKEEPAVGAANAFDEDDEYSQGMYGHMCG